jgi:hypothetical protein
LGAPVADFSGTPLSGTAPLSVAFTDSSTNTPTSWLWEKNDGSGWVAFTSGSTSQNPTESFTAGTWSVRLTATNAAGSDTKTRTNYVVSTAPVVVEEPAGGTSKRKKRHKKPLTWAEGLQLAQKKLKEQALASAVEKIEEKQVLEASALAEDEEEDDDIITAIIISRSLH